MPDRIVTLSGWQMPPDALVEVAGKEAISIDYSNIAGDDCMEKLLRRELAEVDTLIGWSLGGCLAVRAVAQGWCHPLRLILIGTPFHFTDTQSGTPENEFQAFVKTYADSTHAALQQFLALNVMGDSEGRRIRRSVKSLPPWHKQAGGYGLQLLHEWNAAQYDLQHFPPVLLLHGNNDAVVPVAQAVLWESALPASRKVILERCGHAPHWHHPAAAAALIREFCLADA